MSSPEAHGLARSEPEENFRATNIFPIGIQCALVEMVEQGQPLGQKNNFPAHYSSDYGKLRSAFLLRHASAFDSLPQ